MKVGTPFGVVPFEYRRIELRRRGITVVGIVAGFELSVLIERKDLLRGFGSALAVTIVLRLARRAGVEARRTC